LDARTELVSGSTFDAGRPFDWILQERELKELAAELSSRSFGPAVERVRKSWETSHQFDTCLMMSACALACHLGIVETMGS
jgi:hypothetical protein